MNNQEIQRIKTEILENEKLIKKTKSIMLRNKLRAELTELKTQLAKAAQDEVL